MNTYLSYLNVTRDLARSLDRVEKKPVVERESAYYLENIEKVKSIKDFVGNDRLFRYAMKAHGLSDMAYAKAFMVKVLEGGVRDSDSFANKLVDRRYAAFAETFDFEQFGATATVFTSARQGTVDAYVRQTLEEDAGAQNEGVRLALYFERKIGEVDSIYGILADPALAKVARTALGLPDAFATTDIEKQADHLSGRIDLEELKDAKVPEALSKFLKRFTSMWEVANPSTSSQPSLAALIQPAGGYGVSGDLLMSLQRLRLGGA